jgi:hypothetical protein
MFKICLNSYAFFLCISPHPNNKPKHIATFRFSLQYVDLQYPVFFSVPNSQYPSMFSLSEVMKVYFHTQLKSEDIQILDNERLI